MAKATSLFDIASAWGVPFGILQYIRYILHGLTSVLLSVPFMFTNGKKCQFGRKHDCFFCIVEVVSIFIVATLITNSSWFVVLCNGLNIANNEAQWVLHSDNNWWAQHLILPLVSFIVATVFTEVLYVQCLIHLLCVTDWTELTKMHNGYFDYW